MNENRYRPTSDEDSPPVLPYASCPDEGAQPDGRLLAVLFFAILAGAGLFVAGEFALELATRSATPASLAPLYVPLVGALVSGVGLGRVLCTPAGRSVWDRVTVGLLVAGLLVDWSGLLWPVLWR